MREKKIKKMLLLEKLAVESKNEIIKAEAKKKIKFLQNKYEISRVEIELFRINGGIKKIETTVKRTAKETIETKIEEIKIKAEVYLREEKNKYTTFLVMGTIVFYGIITFAWNLLFSAIQQLGTNPPAMNYWPINMMYVPFFIEWLVIAVIGLILYLKGIIPYKRWKMSKDIKETLKGDSKLENIENFVDR